MLPASDFSLIGMETFDNALLPADRLHIGDCLVTVSSREVQAPGARRAARLTPKAMGVLLALARNAGNVVTRDELFAQVWPDTLPTNDVLTQAVTQLRKAFSAGGAFREGQEYIETIAKTGYRLLVPVTWEAERPAPAQADAVPGAHAPQAHGSVGDSPGVLPGIAEPGQPKNRNKSAWRRWRRTVLLVIGLLLLCSSALMACLLWQRPHQETPLDKATADGMGVVGSPEHSYRLITATQGFSMYPALSPDGALVAYADEADNRSTLKVQSTGSAAPAALGQTPAGASDRFPVWSPDGREIAFARFRQDGRCEVLVMGATGGNVRRATRCDGADLLSFDWTPDGRGLVFGSMTGANGAAGIRVLDLASGRWTPLAYGRSPDDFDYAPRYSPDGGRIGFIRNPQMGGVWTMPAAGGSARRITADTAEMRGWDWLDNQSVVLGRRVDSESRLYRVDVRSGLLKDLGVDDAQSPAVARLGGMLTFVHRSPQFGLFRIPLDHPERKVRLFASLGRDTQPLIAPDGRQLVFTSNRSGTFALWWGRDGQADTLHAIDGFRPEARQPGDWSADSRNVLVSGRDASGHAGIYEVQPEQGQWKRLPIPVHEPLQAVYGPGGRMLVIGRDERGQIALTLFERTASAWRVLAHMPGISQVRYDRAGGRVLFTVLSGAGLWQADGDLSPASVRPLSKDVPTRWRFRTWALGAQGEIAYLNQSADCSVRLSRLDLVEDARCLEAGAASATNGFSMAPDGTAVYAALAVADGTDIGVMPVPKSASRPLLGLLKWLPALEKPDS